MRNNTKRTRKKVKEGEACESPVSDATTSNDAVSDVPTDDDDAAEAAAATAAGGGGVIVVVVGFRLGIQQFMHDAA